MRSTHRFIQSQLKLIIFLASLQRFLMQYWILPWHPSIRKDRKPLLKHQMRDKMKRYTQTIKTQSILNRNHAFSDVWITLVVFLGKAHEILLDQSILLPLCNNSQLEGEIQSLSKVPKTLLPHQDFKSKEQRWSSFLGNIQLKDFSLQNNTKCSEVC